jgi:hypothetical protein
VDADGVQTGWRQGIRWRVDGVIEILPHPHRERGLQSEGSLRDQRWGGARGAMGPSRQRMNNLRLMGCMDAAARCAWGSGFSPRRQPSAG